MLTQYDIDMMASDVREIINMWNMKLTIIKPLPEAEQTNWNTNLHEYSGKIMYDRYDNVVSERKDQQNMIMYELELGTKAGDSGVGKIMLTVPDVYTFIDSSCIVLYESKQWHIKTIKHRVGEIILIIEEILTYEDLNDTPSNIYDVGGLYNV